MAAATDKFRKKRSNFSTTLNGSIGSSDATITLASTSGLPTDTGVTLTIDRVDANGNSTPTKMERVTGVISGNNITSAVRGVDNSPSAQSHSSGAVVEDIWDALSWNDSLSGILVEHNQDGTHLNTVVALLAGSQTFTGAKTFGSGLLKATRPQITTSIDDANGNQMVIYSPIASAVNQITMANAATAGHPKLSATGSDTDINLDLAAKGAGQIRGDKFTAQSYTGFPDFNGEYDNGNSGTAITIDWTKGDRQLVTLTGNVTFTFSNAKKGQTLTLRCVEDGTGGRTLTFPTLKWPGGTVGSATTTANAINLYIFYFDGTNYLAQLSAGFA